MDNTSKPPFPWTFLNDPDGPDACDQAIERRAGNEIVGIAVMYLPAMSHEFAEMIQFASVRETIYAAPDGPRAAHYMELLGQSEPVGLPN